MTWENTDIGKQLENHLYLYLHPLVANNNTQLFARPAPKAKTSPAPAGDQEKEANA
jgi:hypothetical protein